MPTSVAPLSLMASTQAWGSTSTPRSTTLMPLDDSTVPAMFLPNSWMSFLTVPSTMVPYGVLGGLGERVLQRGARLLEDLAGEDELGEVVLAGLEPVADDAHAVLELAQDGERGFAGVQLLLDEACRLVRLQFAHRLGEWGGCHPTSLVSVSPAETRE